MPAITGLLAVTNESPEVPYGYVKIPVDLNKGVPGRYIWLCYTRGDGPAITDIKIKFSKHPALDAGYQFVCDEDGAPQDLNEYAGGEYIYMAYTRAPGVPVVDIFVQAWKYPSPPPLPPVDEYGHQYDRIDAELNKKSGGWYIYANQLKLPDGRDPPTQPSLPQFVEAFKNNTSWEIGRAPIDYDRIAVWKAKVRGYVYTVNASLPTKLTFKSYYGIKETDAREVVHSWELSSDVSGEISGVLGKLTARVGTKVGQSPRAVQGLSDPAGPAPDVGRRDPSVQPQGDLPDTAGAADPGEAGRGNDFGAGEPGGVERGVHPSGQLPFRARRVGGEVLRGSGDRAGGPADRECLRVPGPRRPATR